MPESGMEQGRGTAGAARAAWLRAPARAELHRAGTEVLVELRGVTKSFADRAAGRTAGPAALSDVSLQLAEQTAILVEGPSGSGKTTLLSLIGSCTR